MSRNKYKRKSLDSSNDDINEKGKNHNFDTKNYMVEVITTSLLINSPLGINGVFICIIVLKHFANLNLR